MVEQEQEEEGRGGGEVGGRGEERGGGEGEEGRVGAW